MSATQQQLDDLLEHLLALTELPDTVDAPAIRCARLARLVLLLAERLGDTAAVQAAIAEVVHAEVQPPVLAIP